MLYFLIIIFSIAGKKKKSIMAALSGKGCIMAYPEEPPIASFPFPIRGHRKPLRQPISR